MKKTLLAVALIAGLTCATSAYADAVTLYGLVDSGIGYNAVKRKHKSQSHVRTIQGVDAGSRFGLRGSESLGDGLSAVFKLESGVDSNSGRSLQGGRLFGRASYVGLESDAAGGLYFGRQSNGGDAYMDSIDPFYTGYGFAGTDTVFSNSLRADNMIVYKTPNMSGLSAMAGYSFTASDKSSAAPAFQNRKNDRLLTFAAVYDNGPLHVVGLYDRYRAVAMPADPGIGLAATPKTTIQASMLGAAYDFEVVKLYGAVGQTRNGWISGKDLDGKLMRDDEKMSGARVQPGFKAVSTMLGISAPVGSGSLMSSWQRADPNSKKLTTGRHVMNVYSLGYRYDLSRRTALYAYGALTEHFAFVDAQDRSAGIGMRHSF